MKDIIIMCQTGITASCSHFNNLFWMTFKLNCILIQIQRRKPTSLTSFANQPVNTLIIKYFNKAESPPLQFLHSIPDTETIILFSCHLVT